MRRPPRRVPVTEAMLANAFKDPQARVLLGRARIARLQQDSLLLSYDATTYQRLSVGIGVKAFSRNRLLLRHENATHVQWQRGSGAWVELKGRRTALPMSEEGEKDADAGMGDMGALPYFPGKEELWVGGGGLVKAQVDERQIVHPVAEGAEAYYRYETGDSVIMTLPDGHRITLRELRISAREPKWNVTVGSFWFDEETAHLVRAVYRLSAPMDIWAVAKSEDPHAMDDVPAFVKPMITPMRAELSAVTVEYGLYNQRFWLPRTETLDAAAMVSFMRVPVTMEQRYAYASVNGLDSLPKVPGPANPRLKVLRDSMRAAETPMPVRDSIMKIARKEAHQHDEQVKAEQCATTGMYTMSHSEYNGAVQVAFRTPCDSTKLATAKELPGSIYDANEQLFGTAERDDLIKSLGFGLQAGWAPQPPAFAYGLAFTRYNRVEGLSSGASLESVLGDGYTATLGARAGLGDRQFNGDFTLSRSNGRATIRGTVYRRLDVATDFGTPLSFGSSMASLLYGRDEGAYFRTWGVEFAGHHRQWGDLDWRLFAERQWTADVNSRWTLLGGGGDSRFIGNPPAQRAAEYGGSLRVQSSVGLDPNGWRLLSDVRAEGAGGLLVSPGLAGFGTMAQLAATADIGLPIFSHPSFQGSFVASPDAGISHGALFGQIARLAGGDASIYPNYGGRFSFSQAECREIADACAAPLGHLRPIFPTPGGGMTVERVGELLDFYGSDVILLIGGGLFQYGPDLAENCRAFRRAAGARGQGEYRI